MKGLEHIRRAGSGNSEQTGCKKEDDVQQVEATRDQEHPPAEQRQARLKERAPFFGVASRRSERDGIGRMDI